ncbi:hypothetical protein H7900_12340, partial [Staphylococcus haemolyticus]|nr:hypothetical protein [Staphylococcus haemolyticus]
RENERNKRHEQLLTTIETTALNFNQDKKKLVYTRFKNHKNQNNRVQVIVKSGPTPNLNSVSYKVVN